ncbi:MAG: biotin-dependent carboxyltransferase family protein [Pseudomonadota bacterium]
MLRVIKPGLQTTLQGAPRRGVRHFGVPACGPADTLSLALANRLVGNAPTATGLEITYGGFVAAVERACAIAITGAFGGATVAGRNIAPHRTLHLKPGDEIDIAPPQIGARTYLAIRSGFQADEMFGAASTYLPAAFGGLSGRVLQAQDRLAANGLSTYSETLTTPDAIRPVFTASFALRACKSAETSLLSRTSQACIFAESFVAGRQATRMGLALTGHTLELASDGKMLSAPVFPGLIQCPPSGTPIVLLADAQTTGGYPRIASIARCDRHLLGQIRPGNFVQLLARDPDQAATAYREKKALLAPWLDG